MEAWRHVKYASCLVLVEERKKLPGFTCILLSCCYGLSCLCIRRVPAPHRICRCPVLLVCGATTLDMLPSLTLVQVEIIEAKPADKEHSRPSFYLSTVDTHLSKLVGDWIRKCLAVSFCSRICWPGRTHRQFHQGKPRTLRNIAFLMLYPKKAHWLCYWYHAVLLIWPNEESQHVLVRISQAQPFTVLNGSSLLARKISWYRHTHFGMRSQSLWCCWNVGGFECWMCRALHLWDILTIMIYMAMTACDLRSNGV